MKIEKCGMPSLIECETLEENISLCRRLGLNLLELNMNLPLGQLEFLKKTDFPEDLEISLHLPEEFNVWDMNGKIKNAYREQAKEILDFALDRGITTLTMHMNRGVYFTLPDRKVFLFERYRDNFREDTLAFRELVRERAAGTELSLNLENTEIFRHPFISEAVDTLLECDNFNLTWDIGHDHGSGWQNSQFILPRIGRVKHLHLHDGRGAKNHLPLGTGEIDVPSLLSRFSPIPSCILETKTGNVLAQSVNYLRERRIL
ncbi:MAG: TIM barrel protein [Spirochaetales bacterium]|nr:TIM barrel protein [Spirochaetales bacterium]